MFPFVSKEIPVKTTLMAALLIGAFTTPLLARAETPEFTIVIKDHRFEPAEIVVPAETKVKLVIDNRDATPEEFESHELRREKVIAGGSKASVWVGPLKPGTYAFFGEYHEDTAKGRLIVK
jgi:plastocyanin